jgi:hypothetical protein
MGARERDRGRQNPHARPRALPPHRRASGTLRHTCSALMLVLCSPAQARRGHARAVTAKAFSRCSTARSVFFHPKHFCQSAHVSFTPRTKWLLLLLLSLSLAPSLSASLPNVSVFPPQSLK